MRAATTNTHPIRSILNQSIIVNTFLYLSHHAVEHRVLRLDLGADAVRRLVVVRGKGGDGAVFFERERKWQTLSALCCHAAAAAACTHTSHLRRSTAAVRRPPVAVTAGAPA